MDAATILEIKPALTTFLHEFDGCFGRRTTSAVRDLEILQVRVIAGLRKRARCA
jgi:hypothetical protein